MPSRATLPEEFFDITSPQLLLQPESQYLLANLAKTALATDLAVPDFMGRAGVGSESGADYPSAESLRLALEMKSMLAATFAVAMKMDGLPGHTVNFNRPQFANTTYTKASREVPAGSSVSTTPVENIGAEQVPITLKRYAGPYDGTNSRVAPYALEKFDATVGLHRMSRIVGTHLQRDFDRFIDSVFVLLGESAVAGGSAAIYPTGFTTDDSIGAIGAAKMDYNTISRAERALDEANVPYFATGKRVLLATPQQVQELQDDSQFARYAHFHRDVNPLFPGFIGSVNTFDLFKSNTIRKVNNASTVPVNRGLAFGPGIFGAGMGQSPRVAQANEDNYGETPKVIWIAYLALEMLDNRFGVSVRTG